MMKECTLIGIGGHSRSLLTLLQNAGFAVSGLYDDCYNPQSPEDVFGVPLRGTLLDVPTSAHVSLAIGDNVRRQSLFDCYHKQILCETILHPQAIVEDHVKIGRANQVFARAFLNAGVTIGDNCILNSGCIVEHESSVGSHSHVAVGAVLCGRVHIGDRVLVGAGAVLNPGVTVANDVTIGTGAVVSRNIEQAGVYVGIPARRIA